MRVLLVYPDYPGSYLSLDKILKRMGNKIQQPPLGLITLAALLPDEWNFEIIELKTRKMSETDWNRCDLGCCPNH